MDAQSEADRVNAELEARDPLARYPVSRAPLPGSTVLLVFRQAAPCGCWCATGEGEVAPTCCHGEKLLPVEPPVERLGFVGRLQPEQTALREVQEQRAHDAAYQLRD